ncbi:MAG: MATE family efflux transporter [Mageeibacillus sp.]|jgi:putative MATE family efflux protein|nr:MATE family efflux transporter [Mageeibacillus sp.]MCI1264818.1 MATE family efflux transporter [Saccharofermentans sp.]MCI1769802.1 MATE family efflux transporter [Mageeibacillus sp.]MCI2044685.1 MATE family efflux transporter [Mageeibacillus sp.]
MKNYNDPVFRKKLVSLILPMTLQNFMFALVPVSDTVMLAALSQNAMSAVSLATQVTFVLNLFVFAVTANASMFAAQYWGKGDVSSIEKLFGYAVRIVLPVLLVFFSCAMFLPEGVMRIYTSDPAIIAEGIPYLRFAAPSYVLMALAMVYETILKNTGFVKQCTFASAVMVVMNIILNAVFIFGLLGAPEMGAAGAALATAISYGLGFFACVLFSFKPKAVRLRLKYIIHTDMEFRRSFSKYSTPYLLNQLLWGFGFTMISVILGHMGSDAVAANAIVAVVKDLVSCFCYALGSGGAIVVGNELGAGRLEQAKLYGGRLSKLTIISGIILGLIAAASTPLVLSLVSLTDTAEHYLGAMLMMCSYYILGRSINATLIGGIFSAGGDTKFGLICDSLTMWAFIVPLGAFAAFVLKLPVLVVYFILNLDEIIKLPAVYIHYKKYKWVRNIVSDKEII